jgi:hypothetical protein
VTLLPIETAELALAQEALAQNQRVVQVFLALAAAVVVLDALVANHLVVVMVVQVLFLFATQLLVSQVATTQLQVVETHLLLL